MLHTYLRRYTPTYMPIFRGRLSETWEQSFARFGEALRGPWRVLRGALPAPDAAGRWSIRDVGVEPAQKAAAK